MSASQAVLQRSGISRRRSGLPDESDVAGWIEAKLRPLSAPTDRPAGPAELTNRARRCVVRCHNLVQDLKALTALSTNSGGSGESLSPVAYRRAAAMAEAAVGCVRSLPDAPALQMRLCDGLDGLLDALADRIGGLRDAARRTGLARDRVATLAHLLTGLAAGSTQSLEPFTALAEAVVTDARQGEPLYFFDAGTVSPAAGTGACREWLARHIACHGLMTAQVVARATRLGSDVVVAALLHDVGMLTLTPELVAQPGEFTADQRRAMECHAVAGANLVAEHLPLAQHLCDVIRGHHERLDGTGYPDACTKNPPLRSLMAAADAYAALVSPRPHRPAVDTRTALAQVVLAAHHGAIDAAAAQSLSSMTYFPVGTAVVLSDGSVGLVVATNAPGQDPQLPARPVVSILADQDGRPLPGATVVNLAVDDRRSVVRALAADIRRQVFAASFPQFV